MPASFNLVVAALAATLTLALARARDRNLDRERVCDFNGTPGGRALPVAFGLQSTSDAD